MSDEWISNLKAGDKVYSRGTGMAIDIYTLHTVKRITSKGAVRLDDDILYKEEIHYAPFGGSSVLVQWTPELEAELKAISVIVDQMKTVLKLTSIIPSGQMVTCNQDLRLM